MDLHDAAPTLPELQEQAQEIATRVIFPLADEIDREARWPREAMQALRQSRLTGLQVPTHLGGHGQGLLGLATLVETLARGCPATAMCFGMHCVGTAVIAARATAVHEERYLAPIAAGEHLTTLSLSESGTGANFFLSDTELRRDGDFFHVRGQKQFVTNGSHADSYVVSTRASVPSDRGDFSCLLIDRDLPGIQWGEPWRGFGMRGNDSRAMTLDVRVPAANLLGNEGDEVWYVFEVIAPYFLVAMAAVYVGLAHSALSAATHHLMERRHSHSGETLAHQPTLQHRIGELWIAVERSRQLLLHAARQGDLGSAAALPCILACKVEAAETAVTVANEAMTLAGGMGFRENGLFARLLRDARAGHVMSPTTEMLKLWTGRVALGLPLL